MSTLQAIRCLNSMFFPTGGHFMKILLKLFPRECETFSWRGGLCDNPPRSCGIGGASSTWQESVEANCFPDRSQAKRLKEPSNWPRPK